MPTWLTKQAAGTLTGNEVMGVFQDGVFRRLTLTTLRDYVLQGSSISILWSVSATYQTDDITSYNDRFWRSLQDNNIANIPTEGAFWTEVSKAENLTLWSPGVITAAAEYYTFYVIDGVHQLFRLEGARPFFSSDFLAEYAAGDWELVSERGYMIITETAHGFSLGDSLVRNTGAWALKSDNTQIPIAIVKTVVDANTAVIQLLGNRSAGFSGLTDADYYYSQSDGSLDTTVSPYLIMVAISATEAIVLSGGGVSGGLLDGDYGDIIVSMTGSVITLDDNVVSNSKFRQSAGLSVVGRSANTTGNVADITGTAGQILRISGTTLGFGNDGLNTLTFNTGQGINSAGVLTIGVSATSVDIGAASIVNLYSNGVSVTLNDSIFVSTVSDTTATEISQTPTQISLTFGDGVYVSSFKVNTTDFEIDSDDPGFEGLKYSTDFSANFTSESLINLGYAQVAFWETDGETELLGDVFISGSYNIGFGEANPTAKLHLLAGTTVLAPLKLTTGTAVTTIAGDVNDGAFEYHGSHLWFTIGSTRHQLDQQAAGVGITQGANTLTANLELDGDAFQFNFLVYSANIAFFNGTPDFESGEGIMYFGDANTAPSAAPTDGVFQWVGLIDGVSRLHTQDSDGNITVL